MNLPFGITGVKESSITKKEYDIRSISKYERKLADYRDTLETYKNCITEYSSRLDNYEKRSFNNQLSIIQTALDITYMKEQGDKVLDLLEEFKLGPLSQMNYEMDKLTESIVDTKQKLDNIDENIINNVCELLAEGQKQTQIHNMTIQEELISNVERLDNKVRVSNSLIWFLVVFNILTLSGLAFVIWYITDVLSL